MNSELWMKVGALRAVHGAIVAVTPESKEAKDAWNEAIRFANKAVLREWEYASTNDPAGEQK